MRTIVRRFLLIGGLLSLQLTTLLNAATYIEVLDTTFEAHRYELIWNRDSDTGLLIISENECVGCSAITLEVDSTVIIKIAGQDTKITIADIPSLGVADVTVTKSSNAVRVVNLEE